MIYGSVCSGIEAASVAWHGLGWEPAFLSEIEPFPKAVLAHRWPGVPDLGDFTTIGADRGPVDLLVGGTPCQSFSVAGLRGGLADARGNLALEFLRLAARLDARWVLWENVPGVLSSNGGRDFGAFLGGLAELGYGFAYRVLDAQFFGVAQRRRRVFVVGHAGGLWQRAAAVLFERASLRGDPPPSRATREGAPVGALAGTSPGGGWRVGGDEAAAGHIVPISSAGERARALTAHAGRYDLDTETFIAAPLTSSFAKSRASCNDGAGLVGENRCRPEPGSPSHPLAAGAHPPAIAFHVTQDPISGEVAPALGCGNALGCGTLGVATPILEPGRRSGRSTDDPRIGLGVGVPGDPMFTLNAQRPHGLAVDYTNGIIGNPVSETLEAAQSKGNRGHGVLAGMAVRRLTPRECERLQGFPDDYTAIPGAKDGPRYRALGNSMAVPVMAWIGRRIAAVDASSGGAGRET
jgi:DNA (cytosine-5)-methyltransferase 1